MEAFELMHGSQLSKAQRMLQQGYSRIWRIALWKRLEPLDLGAEIKESTMDVIDVRLDRNGRLMPADELSERLIEKWENEHVSGRD